MCVARLLVLAAFGFAGCASYPIVLREFDSIAGYDRQTQKEPAKLEYREFADRYPALLRPLEWVGAGSLLNALFATRQTPVPVDNPPDFVRTRIRSMASVAGRNLARITAVTWRLLLVIEKDPTPLNRAVAIRELARLTRVFDDIVTDGKGVGFATPTPSAATKFRERAKELSGALASTWPGLPKSDRSRNGRDRYATALRDLSRLDAAGLEQERIRLRLMREALDWEPDAEVLRFTARATIAALHSAIARGLATGIRDPEPRVRQAAIAELWNHGRDRILPWLLFALEARTKASVPPALVPAVPFDLDADVRRQVLRLCWAVDTAKASEQFDNGPSPYRTLVEAALQDPKPALRLLAGEALAFHLRRPVEPHPTWIREWWRSFVSAGQPAR